MGTGQLTISRDMDAVDWKVWVGEAVKNVAISSPLDRFDVLREMSDRGEMQIALNGDM